MARHAVLSPRQAAEDALRGGRYAEAVRLALDLPDTELLAEAVIRRCREWRQNGQTLWAADLIRKVLPRFSTDDAARARLARELVECGGLADAQELVADPGSLVDAAADSAVAQGTAGRTSLPADLHAGFDAVLAASAAFESGDDEMARERLISIGLGSPFLEWKMLLRGLMAWHAGDDAKALDNWSRLKPDRLPATLVAPLRGSLDAGFLRAKPADEQARLRRMSDQLVGGGLLAALRKLHTELGRDDLTTAFRQAEALVPRLRDELPAVIPALQAVLAQAVIHHGQPHHVDRWRKFLPPPADDPTLDRLSAELHESTHDDDAAVRHWQAYEQALAARPELFGDNTGRARAMVLSHVADLVSEGTPELAELADMFGIRGRPQKQKKPKGDAARLYDAALQLAPDLLDALRGRVELALEALNDESVLRCGDELLRHHPHHRPTLEALDAAARRLGDPVRRVAYAEALLAIDPLDGAKRSQAAATRRAAARVRMRAGEFEAAQTDLDAAASADADSADAVYVQRAALAQLTKQPEAVEAELAQVRLPPVALAARAVAEAVTLKLPKPFKARFEPTFKAALDGPGTPADALALAAVFRDWAHEGLTYHGGKTHEKKAQARLLAALDNGDADESDLSRACTLAREADWWGVAAKLAARGARRFRRNPRFAYEQAVAELATLGRRGPGFVEARLDDAERLLDKLPPHARPADLVRGIPRAREQLKETEAEAAPSFLDELIDAFNTGGRPF